MTSKGDGNIRHAFPEETFDEAPDEPMAFVVMQTMKEPSVSDVDGMKFKLGYADKQVRGGSFGNYLRRTKFYKAFIRLNGIYETFFIAPQRRNASGIE